MPGFTLKPEKRLVGDRFRRIWQIAMTIADEPGMTRGDLAKRFNLSERQVQADLIIMRDEMALPLVRRQGYRFTSEGVVNGGGAIDLQEAQLLVMILRRAMNDRDIPKKRLRSLMDKLAVAFPPHITPIITSLMEAVRNGDAAGQTFTAMADAILREQMVSVRVDRGGLYETWQVQPHLLIPYVGRWYVLAEQVVGSGRLYSRMIRLDRVLSIGPATLQAAS